ncbi:MAG: tRNA lysidine(34) synthetase TilS, partial [Nitrospiraceae bacterium]|nr:tRNA lysidine(34) synthetase TilS [Nitrospiraceae bacterium]
MTASTTPNQSSQRGWPALLHRVIRTIRSNRLVEPGQHVLIGISGGPDSVALLSVLHRLSRSWHFSLKAAHFNYGLRGRESDQDEQFVRALCHVLDVPLSVMALDVRSRARGTSLQAAARDLRYRALTTMAEEGGADRIAVGHTADDQAETVLLWMLRGAGLRGLSGMPVSREGKIVRPLYDCSRRQVLDYLAGAGLAYREDSSNATPAYTRNRIRQELVPVITRLHPSGVRALCRLADLCREDDGYLEVQTAALCAEHIRKDHEGVWVVERPFVQQLPRALQRRVVRDLLRRRDPLERAPSVQKVERVIQAVMKNGTGRLALGRSAQILIGAHTIRLMAFGERDPGDVRLAPLSISGQPDKSTATWPGTNQTIRIQHLSRELVHDIGPRPD